MYMNVHLFLWRCNKYIFIGNGRKKKPKDTSRAKKYFLANEENIRLFCALFYTPGTNIVALAWTHSYQQNFQIKAAQNNLEKEVKHSRKQEEVVRDGNEQSPEKHGGWCSPPNTITRLSSNQLSCWLCVCYSVKHLPPSSHLQKTISISCRTQPTALFGRLLYREFRNGSHLLARFHRLLWSVWVEGKFDSLVGWLKTKDNELSLLRASLGPKRE